MNYLDIIPLSEAKNYLKLNDTLTQDNANVTRMIKAALMDIERLTNIHLIDKQKEFFFSNFCTLVYDYPINSIVSPLDTVREEKSQYSIYVSKNLDDKKLVLNVGYSDVIDVPSDLVEVAYEMIDIMYYAKEYKLSEMSKNTINSYKRFII